MNTVIYTDDMEPITVIDLPYEFYTSGKDWWVVPIIRPPSSAEFLGGPVPKAECFKVVNLRKEIFRRKGREHPFFFTEDEEFALMLKPALLPVQIGEQRRREIEAYRAGFCSGLLNLG